MAKAKPDWELFADVLWSDPDENVTGVTASSRGVGVLFGEKVTKQVLSAVDGKVLIRGHQAYAEGYHLNHGGKVLTLFSRKGWPYFNDKGAYLVLPLQPKFESAEDLKSFIVQF